MYALTLKKSNSVLIRTDTFGMTAVIGFFFFFFEHGSLYFLLS